MKKPWNRINLPVYSVSSFANGKYNMNICTYCSAVSMQPKRFMVAVYKETQTLFNIEKNPIVVLQLLSANQHNLIKLLGKQSGKNTNKIQKLNARKMQTELWNEFEILKDALAVIKLNLTTRMDAGDHWMYLCDVLTYKNCNDGEPLTIDILRAKKLVRM